MTKTNKVYLAALLLVILLQSVEGFVCTEAMYEDFLSHWQRNFTQQKLSPEFTSKFSTYCTNKEEVTTTNGQNLSYKLNEYWEWMDKSDDQRAKLVRIQFTPQSIAATAQPADDNSLLRKVGVVPLSKDWRASNDVSSIKNQGSCGCCWSFTTVGLYESWMMAMGEQQYDLSEQYILQCTTLYTKNILKQNYTSECTGGYVDFAGALARVNGIPAQSTYPYIAGSYTGSTYPNTSGICSANVTYMYNANPSATTFNINTNNTNDKMKLLLSVAPVGVLIYANSGFQAYSSGVYTGCPASFATSYSNINHAVVIVGYDSSGNYIVKNSWGTSWGQNGYGVVSKDADCAISAYAYQYNSAAAPGGGVLYYNQTNLGASSFAQWIIGVSLGLLMIVMMVVA